MRRTNINHVMLNEGGAAVTKRWVRVFLWICVILTAGMIYIFSSQDGETSSAISQGIIRMILEQLSGFFGEMPEAQRMEWLLKLDHLIRKAAHMSEFALLGFFTLLLVRSYRIRWEKRITWCGCTLYAVSDELHQQFSVARVPDFMDVCIDSLGVCIGIGIALFGIWMVHRQRCAGKKEGV